MRRKTLGMKIFTVFLNYAFLTLLAISCLLPMLNQLAISFSSSSAVAAGEVGLLPVDFTLDSYKYMADKPEFWKSLSVSLGRILLAVPISMIVCVLAAFPLSRLDHEFPAKKILHLGIRSPYAHRRRPDPYLYGSPQYRADRFHMVPCIA